MKPKVKLSICNCFNDGHKHLEIKNVWGEQSLSDHPDSLLYAINALNSAAAHGLATETGVAGPFTAMEIAAALQTLYEEWTMIE